MYFKMNEQNYQLISTGNDCAVFCQHTILHSSETFILQIKHLIVFFLTKSAGI